MLSKQQTITALSSLKNSYEDLRSYFRSQNVTSIVDDVCRRNMMMSPFQEKHFADQLRNQYPDTINDGQTGKSDIYIPSLNREIECKLTSVGKTGGYQLQTDYSTLIQKERLDYLYVCTDRDFDKFAVLYFEGLTTDDFKDPYSGSRGKAQMKKEVAFEKASILFGDVTEMNTTNIKKLQRKLANLSPRAVKTRDKIKRSIEFWNNKTTTYSIELHSIL